MGKNSREQNYSASEKIREYIASWKLRDIIMMSMLCIVFGAVYLGAVYLAAVLEAPLIPFGISLLNYEIVFGVWFMAATLSAFVLRKPGAAIIAEVIASVIEVLMGNMFGPMVILAGIIQGAGGEAVFLATRYKKFGMGTMCLAAAGCCVTSFAWSFVRSGYGAFAPSMLVVMFLIRLLSSVLLSGVLCKLMGDGLTKSGLLKSYAAGARRG